MNNNVVINERGNWAVEPYELAGPDRSPPPRQRHLDLAAIVAILLRWRWLILGAVAGGLLLGILVTMVTKPMYRSDVTLEVNPPSVAIMADDQQRDQGTSPQSWDYVVTQVGLLQSRSIAERAAQDLNLANNRDFVGDIPDAATRLDIAASKVASGLEVEMPRQGQLIHFSYVAETPQLSASIANQIAESFISSNLQRRYDSSAYARKFLEQQIAKTRGDLELSERKLAAYAQAQGIIITETGDDGTSKSDVSSLQGESLVALNRALADATARRVAAEGAYRSGSAVGVTSEVAASTQVLRQTRAGLEADYQDKRQAMKPDHPEMLSLRSRIEELDRQIARESGQASAGRNNSLLADYRGALAAENALRSRVAGLKGSVLDLRGRSIQYNILKREVDTNRSLYDALLQRFKEVGVAGGIGTAPVSIVDRADVPGGPYKPNLIFNLLAGLLAGLIAGLGVAFALEFLNDVIKTREDVRNKLGLACLGAIPKSAADSAFVEELKDIKSNVSEAYSTVVASLRFSTEDGLPRTLVVTSTRPTEGKSSSSLALAQNFARRGVTVLLIDADMRKPAFRASNDKVGLTRLLTDDKEAVGGHILPTQFPDLYLMPSGPLPPNPADLLSSVRFRQILEEASSHVGVIIIDAPPVLGLADSPLLASVAEHVMFVVESGKTRTKAAIEAIGQLRNAGAHIVGATLTKANEDVGGYGYGYKGYGYGAVEGKRTEIALIPQDS